MKKKLDFNIYYVGQANFTIIIKDENALIYDCGTSNKIEWLESDDVFIPAVEKYLKKIFKKIKNILVIISHTDMDHMNLVSSLNDFLEINKIKNIEIIMDGDEKTLKKQLDEKKYFFNSNSDSKNNSKIIIESFVPRRNNKYNNENSIILKIIGKFKNDETYSFLLTGDASEKTLNGIIQQYYENKERIVAIKDIFEDVICHLIPHHGSILNNSYIWAKYVIIYSKYPSINIISSNPSYANGKPSFEIIEKIFSYIKNNPLNKKKYYNNFYCVPHYIACNFKSKIFKYTSVSGEFVVPLFVTYDSFSNGYKIRCNSKRLVFEDNIVINRKNKIKIPLYVLNISKTYFSEKNLFKVYAYYLALKKLEKHNSIYHNLNNINIENDKINLNNINDVKTEIGNHIFKLEKYHQIKKINEKICNLRRSSVQYLKLNERNVERFKILTLNLKHSPDEVNEFLHCNGIINNLYDIRTTNATIIK
eukprot:jgi/Orpsp1_1/1191909/evm.model.d7180000089314.2